MRPDAGVVEVVVPVVPDTVPAPEHHIVMIVNIVVVESVVVVVVVRTPGTPVGGIIAPVPC
jgi:hypothetical protein